MPAHHVGRGRRVVNPRYCPDHCRREYGADLAAFWRTRQAMGRCRRRSGASFALFLQHSRAPPQVDVDARHDSRIDCARKPGSLRWWRRWRHHDNQPRNRGRDLHLLSHRNWDARTGKRRRRRNLHGGRQLSSVVRDRMEIGRRAPIHRVLCDGWENTNLASGVPTWRSCPGPYSVPAHSHAARPECRIAAE